MNCLKCGSANSPNARFCVNCGESLAPAKDGVRVSGFAVDNSGGGQSVFNIGTAAQAPGGDHCPICGRYNRLEATFRCMSCGRASICVIHQDPKTFYCSTCMDAIGKPQPETLFQINYQFVYPYLPRKKEALAQVLVNFTSRQDADYSSLSAIPTHLYMVLDVSGSMNTPEKYPLLRQAIPHLIHALSDEDSLTIVLFSQGHHVVLSEPVGAIRDQVDSVLQRIDQSGVKFGRMTMLAPALRAVLAEMEHAHREQSLTADRLYVLTDGDLHDAADCYSLNPRLRSLEAEFHSYGFGPDFALDTMRKIMDGVPGGTIKPILNTRDVQNTFGHIGELAERIVAQEAEFSFKFAEGITAGDAFRYQPGAQYFGGVDARSKTFSIKPGSLERDRMYTFLFEGRLQAGQKAQQPFGTATLLYRLGGQVEKIEMPVHVDRSDDEWRCAQADEGALNLYQVLDGLRKDDPQTQLKALYARRAIYQRELADPELVALVEESIAELEAGSILSEPALRKLKADRSTAVGPGFRSVLQSQVAIWLQNEQPAKRVKWLSKVVKKMEAEDWDVVEVLIDNKMGFSEAEMRVINILREGRDPFASLDAETIRKFDAAIK